ncbi:hypothetical protein FHW69_002947 [Luteibacter sp. Sphag1AF]|uniref:GNAT family N-acetyltransferase n=1 Tax=Luteibacter sp. Sphag1AF TaxID=2587031 RepID=UPI00160FCA40|nr:GNAT family N-acetyltransferase [Luteibacter sp. Sphag1AF]MBB3228312.1 hypothetical protein [Luteibacter sp. Sphag1AF]
MTDQPLDIVHDTSHQAFRTTVDGHACILTYTLDKSGVMAITHTSVPQAVGGRGVASALTLAAVQAAQASGWKVVPQCSYAAAWFRRHGEYSSLLA